MQAKRMLMEERPYIPNFSNKNTLLFVYFVIGIPNFSELKISYFLLSSLLLAQMHKVLNFLAPMGYSGLIDGSLPKYYMYKNEIEPT